MRVQQDPIVIEDVASPSQIARFNATIGGNPDQAHLYGFHWGLFTPTNQTDALNSDGHPLLEDAPWAGTHPRRMWAGSEISFFQPIIAGAVMTRHTTLFSVDEKKGRDNTSLVFVVYCHHIRCGDTPVLTEKQTICYRQAATAQQTQLAPPQRVDTSAWECVRQITPSTMLLFRYSALTFNTHRIHYDCPYAQETEGYPSLVVHGPLTATLLMQLAAEMAPNQPLKHVCWRARRPAFVDAPLTFAGTRQPENAITLAALDHAGTTVMEMTVTLD